MQLEIICYPDYTEHTFAQAKYLVHGFDDVLWTNDYLAAVQYLTQELQRWEDGYRG